MTGTAGATLIGLLFVVITLGSGLREQNIEQGIHAFLTPTLVHFGSVLSQTLIMLVPWPAVWQPGAVLCGLGAFGLFYRIRVFVRMRAVSFVSLDAPEWTPYIVLPLLGSLCLISGGTGFVLAWPFAPFAVAIASTLLLFTGIYGAWDLTLWIVRNRPRDKG
jgi:hypothetical protein